jgi:hypothetical protein
MAQITLARSFIEALARLEPIDTKRTAAFLEKLLDEPDAGGLHTEMIRGANDRTVRSMRVTADLRAIAQQLGDELVLLFVGHHDEAYSWARAHCSTCEPEVPRPSLGVLSLVDSPAAPTYARAKSQTTGAAYFAPDQVCRIVDGRELCRVLDEAHISHGLAH